MPLASQILICYDQLFYRNAFGERKSLRDQSGSIHAGRAMNEIGAHCTGQNSISIGICYIGGLSSNGKPKDTRTPQQRAAMLSLIEQLREEFPGVTLHGHNEFANKACPCFKVPTEL